jgi:hypothetical protein
MIRPLVTHFAAGITLAVAAVNGAAESFPVVHTDPIIIHIVGGKTGQPLARLHLTLIAGYDQRDMREQLFREEVLTDEQGRVRLSNQFANLPWLQLWVGKKSLCQTHPRSASYSVDLIRRDGLSAPNRCGMATVENKPGVFTVFVKSNAGIPAVAIADAAPEDGAPAIAGGWCFYCPAWRFHCTMNSANKY